MEAEVVLVVAMVCRADSGPGPHHPSSFADGWYGQLHVIQNLGLKRIRSFWRWFGAAAADNFGISDEDCLNRICSMCFWLVYVSPPLEFALSDEIIRFMVCLLPIDSEFLG